MLYYIVHALNYFIHQCFTVVKRTKQGRFTVKLNAGKYTSVYEKEISTGLDVSPLSIILLSALSEFAFIICPQGSRFKRLCHGILLKRQCKRLQCKLKRQTKNEIRF